MCSYLKFIISTIALLFLADLSTSKIVQDRIYVQKTQPLKHKRMKFNT